MVFIFRVLSRHFGFAGDWEKIGARMSVGVGGGEWLGKLFTSPQLSTVFLIQDGGLNNRWEHSLVPPKSACTAG